MRRSVFIGLAALLGVLLAGGVDDSFADPPSTETKTKAPVDNWGDWWTSSQFGPDDRVSKEAITSGDNSYRGVQYGPIQTPWGTLEPVLQVDPSGVVSVEMFLARANQPQPNELPMPGKGDIKCVIFSGTKVLREPTNGEPEFGATFSRRGYTQYGLLVVFAALPVDFEDYWIRIDMQKQRHWLLIPYGLGITPGVGVNLEATSQGEPKRPESMTTTDIVHSWRSVHYDLGRIVERGWRVEAFVSNPFDAEVTIRLYDDPGRWTLAFPRTAAVVNWPGGYSRFSSWTSIRRGDASDHFRSDTYQFWRTPRDTRNWGILRICVEDHKFDRVIPSSLFNYCHGRAPQR